MPDGGAGSAAAQYDSRHMDKLKKIFMVLSFVFICICFAASVWLYTVLHDETSIMIMAVMFVGLVWFGYNLRGIFKEK